MSDRAKQGLPSLEALVQQGVNNALKDLHTAMPGFIDSFDPATQTCTVQPAIKRIFVGGEPVALPLLVNVPVSFPTAGGYSITFPIAQGDECLIIFSERSLDNWLKFGELKIPNDRRFHDLSDGVVIMGLRSNPNALASYDAENFVIRNEANDVKITIEAATGNVVIDTAADFNINAANVNINGALHVTGDINSDGDVLAGSISLANHTHGYVGAGTGSSPQVSDPPS